MLAGIFKGRKFGLCAPLFFVGLCVQKHFNIVVFDPDLPAFNIVVNAVGVGMTFAIAAYDYRD
jgi:hypothetical protein